MLKAGIINVTGYAGSELARLLHAHPEVRLTSVTGRSAAGQRLGEFMPHLSDIDLTITAELGDVDVVFSALPHKASAEAVAPLVRQGLKVVDISADFRLQDPVEYKQWYGVDHPATDLLPQAVYGLTELARNEVKKTKLVANPGCYPTSAILALAPAVKAGIIRNDIIVDAKSGVSGAGRGLSLATHFSEVNENVSAYSLNGHRHLPEIVNELGKATAVGKPQVTFIPHLIPMTRGIFSTCYAPLAEGKLSAGDKAKQELVALYRDFYRDEPFIRVVTTPPQTKQTLGNNLCIVCPTIDPRTNRLVALSCIDNLVKGAAGQAIQNMNLMLGYPEALGLEAIAVFP